MFISIFSLELVRDPLWIYMFSFFPSFFVSLFFLLSYSFKSRGNELITVCNM
uniref:Uncharacterized protein n=1 Tax=Lepeophtheirus salmonis TaxID=72036 RepID=A0A0K2T2K0_LEPSM